MHLAVVDPGVGTPRRAVAVAAAQEDSHFVGPDNGLLSLALDRFGGAAQAVEISNSPARLEPVSPTFHGRDLFAPVAARLALGDPLADHGETIDPGSLERIDRGAPGRRRRPGPRGRGRARGRVRERLADRHRRRRGRRGPRAGQAG